MSSSLDAHMVMTGHSLGRNKLEHLLASGALQGRVHVGAWVRRGVQSCVHCGFAADQRCHAPWPRVSPPVYQAR